MARSLQAEESILKKLWNWPPNFNKIIPGQPGIFFVLKTRILIVLFIILLITSFFVFDLSQYLTLDYLKTNQMRLMKYHEQNMTLTLSLYFLAYILITALSIPGATIMTLAGAGIFGFWTSLIVISFASTIGATLSFLGSRYLFRDWVQNKFGEKLQKVNEGIEREGAFYLFSMRLIPIFPFFMINLLMGLTSIKTPTYFFASQLGMLAGTIIYVNAGVQLSQIESTKDIISPGIIISLVLLGLFPLIVKKLLKR
jgi:uncharacterized membrane protein YdjX (TVP38/TMEM64 family)